MFYLLFLVRCFICCCWYDVLFVVFSTMFYLLLLVRCFICCCWYDILFVVVGTMCYLLLLVRCFICCCWYDVLFVVVGTMFYLLLLVRCVICWNNTSQNRCVLVVVMDTSLFRLSKSTKLRVVLPSTMTRDFTIVLILYYAPGAPRVFRVASISND